MPHFRSCSGPVNSQRIAKSGTVDQACSCNEDYHATLEYSTDMDNGPCACQSSWEYFGEEYYGCDETADWPGNTWCYINGDRSQCPSAEDSSFATETRVWATCMASTSIVATSMECTRCPQGSSSPAGSNNSSAW